MVTEAAEGGDGRGWAGVWGLKRAVSIVRYELVLTIRVVSAKDAQVAALESVVRPLALDGCWRLAASQHHKVDRVPVLGPPVGDAGGRRKVGL